MKRQCKGRGLVYNFTMLKAFALTALLSSGVAAQSGTFPLVQKTPDQLQWTKSPNGVEQSVLVGDPTKPGLYALRLKFPAGLKLQPHTHPEQRIAVVLSGTMYFGLGETFDEKALKMMPAGSTWTEPPNTAHFGFAKDGDVVIQVTGIGPTGTTPIVK